MIGHASLSQLVQPETQPAKHTRIQPLERLIERLDTWFARYQDDVLMYGRGRNNVEHLGDWLIDLFP
ncbi:MAG: hypothetical protein Q8W45_09355, partial [Candidatus Palauibacterales bacterium]|nr:hypothetical protein [Candidatus Palauibacterales bacterium]